MWLTEARNGISVLERRVDLPPKNGTSFNVRLEMQ
jgi:hypothetical protein